MRYRVNRLNPLLTHFSGSSAEGRRFFLFHHAGGTGSAFYSWIDHLKEYGDLYFVELPGYAPRNSQVIPNCWTDIIDLLSKSLAEYMNGQSYFIGHSMGALVAFELSKALERKGLVCPQYLFLHAFKNPEIFHQSKDYSDLSVERLVRTMTNLGGTPAAILKDPSILELLLKNLRLDFEFLQSYSLDPCGSTVGIPMKVYGSTEDRSIPVETLPGWCNFTTGNFAYEVMPGDHFFLHQQQAYLTHDYLTLIQSNERKFG